MLQHANDELLRLSGAGDRKQPGPETADEGNEDDGRIERDERHTVEIFKKIAVNCGTGISGLCWAYERNQQRRRMNTEDVQKAAIARALRNYRKATEQIIQERLPERWLDLLDSIDQKAGEKRPGRGRPS